MTCGWKVWGQQPWRGVRVLVQSPPKTCTAPASKSFRKRAWNGQRGWMGKLRQGWLWPGCAAQDAVASPEPWAAAPSPQCPPAPRGAARPWVPWGTREGVTVGTGGHWPSPGQGWGAPARVGGCEQEGTAWHSGTCPWATTGTGWSWGAQGTPGLWVALQGHPLPTHSGVGIGGAALGTPQPCPQAPRGAQGTHRSRQVRRIPAGSCSFQTVPGRCGELS